MRTLPHAVGCPSLELRMRWPGASSGRMTALCPVSTSADWPRARGCPLPPLRRRAARDVVAGLDQPFGRGLPVPATTITATTASVTAIRASIGRADYLAPGMRVLRDGSRCSPRTLHADGTP